VDTSSVIEIRRSIVVGESLATQRSVYGSLTHDATRGVVHFPAKVLEEPRRGAQGRRKSQSDVPLEWAISVRQLGVPDEDLVDYLPEVLRRAPGLADPDKPSAEDHADPYVVALALQLRVRLGYDVSVVTEDAVAKPFKTSIRDACGLFRLPTLSMRTFLDSRGVWPKRG